MTNIIVAIVIALVCAAFYFGYTWGQKDTEFEYQRAERGARGPADRTREPAAIRKNPSARRRDRKGYLIMNEESLPPFSDPITSLTYETFWTRRYRSAKR